MSCKCRELESLSTRCQSPNYSDKYVQPRCGDGDKTTTKASGKVCFGHICPVDVYWNSYCGTMSSVHGMKHLMSSNIFTISENRCRCGHQQPGCVTTQFGREHKLVVSNRVIDVFRVSCSSLWVYTLGKRKIVRKSSKWNRYLSRYRYREHVLP